MITAWYEGIAVLVTEIAAKNLGIQDNHHVQSESELRNIILHNVANSEAQYAIHKAKGGDAK